MRRLIPVLSMMAGCSTGGSGAIASLRIEGEAAIDEVALREAAADCEDAEACKLYLEGAYIEEGYLSSSVTASQSALQRWTGSRSGTLTVVEGPQYEYGALEIREVKAAGDPLGDPAALQGLHSIRAGDVFRPRRLRELIVALQARYHDAGYEVLNVIPITNMDPATATVDVTVEIERGARIRSPSPN